MRTRPRSFTPQRLCAAALAATSLGMLAAAQTEDASVEYSPQGWVLLPSLPTVGDRQRPEFQDLGIRAGGFLIFPEFALEATYDDNIFADEDGEVDDIYIAARPQVLVRSDWNRHAVGLEAGAEFRRFVDNGSEDTDTGRVNAFGRLDLPEGTTAFGSIGFRREFQPREDPEDAGGEIGEIDTFEARAGVARTFGLFATELTGGYRTIDFTRAVDSDRDRDEWDAVLTVRYAFAPRISPFVRVGYLQRDYDREIDDTGFNRDAERWSFLAGARFLITEILAGEIAAGYSRTEYDDPLLDSSGDLALSGAVTWNPTRLTSVIASVVREEAPTAIAGATNKTTTTAEARVEHELLRNLVLVARAAYQQESWEGIARDDDSYRIALGAQWSVARGAALYLEAGHGGRDSSVPGEDFTRNTVTVGLRLSL